ncbi:MAG: histidine phosphatase family protein [Hyphomonadaceae bacterium]
MTRLFLIRHGEAAAAWGGDDHDPGLSELGRSQAEAAARVLAGLGSLRVLCSPMQRCRETSAPYLAKASAEALIEPRVSEVPTPADIADRRLWLQQNFPWRGGAVRSWREIDARLSPWRQALIECVSSVREDTAVFSHFIAINVVCGAALGRDETIVCKPDYASITELEVSGGRLRLVRHGAEMQAGEVR